MKKGRHLHRAITCIFFAMLMTVGYSQSTSDKELMLNYGNYTSLPREVIYVHLNKTDFLKGEQLGFKAYVMDKHSRRPAEKTKNLYVQLVDEENHVIKEQLVQVKNGVAFGTFKIDELFDFRNYAFKAFTNWSRNFEEPNNYEQLIRIVDIGAEQEKANEISEPRISVSFMPEGGHFIANTLNSLGISVRDSFGFGVPGLQVQLINEWNEVVKTFELNEKGLAKVLVTPNKGSKFRLSMLHQGREQLFDLPKAEERGFALILANRKHNLLFNLNTNVTTLPIVKENDYKLAIHNGSEIKIVRLPKFEQVAVASNIPKNTLFEGINILTVLDQSNTPLLERLYFYSSKSKVKRAKEHNTTVENDSLTIELTYDGVVNEGNLSISVLPGQSIASNPHESLASFGLLAPHLSNPIENAADYFYSKNLSAKDIDLMLLTQGWSAYDWSNIMYFSPTPEYEFEKGIKATIVNKKGKVKNWIAYPHQGVELKRFRPSNENATYAINALFPVQGDRLLISEINKKGDLKEPLISNTIQFSPHEIPRIDGVGKQLGYKNPFDAPTNSGEGFGFALPFDTKRIALEEVTVSENKIEDQRLKQLIDFSFGKVTVFDEKLRKKWPNVLTFIGMQPGFRVLYAASDAQPVIVNTVPSLPLPSVYLDGAPLQSPLIGGTDDLSLLEGLRTTDIEYVEVNRFGLGEGARGAGGAIRIFTRSDYSDGAKKPYGYLDYEYPLTFNRPDEYAIPLYNSYADISYLQYGVLGWFPNLNVKDANTLKFKIPKTDLESIKLNIQGFSNEGDLFSEERYIQLK